MVADKQDTLIVDMKACQGNGGNTYYKAKSHTAYPKKAATDVLMRWAGAALSLVVFLIALLTIFYVILPLLAVILLCLIVRGALSRRR